MLAVVGVVVCQAFTSYPSTVRSMIRFDGGVGGVQNLLCPRGATHTQALMASRDEKYLFHCFVFKFSVVS